ncbi:MAG: BamA/TamA family outer membrane protein [Bryobacteraceae bacterium]|jgi:outer membrane protein assembly complex protein YaeT
MVATAAISWLIVPALAQGRLCVLALLSVFCILPALAAASQYEGKQVTAILFDPPQQPLPDARLKELLPMRIGQPLHPGDIPAAMQQLYSTGEYLDIAVDASLADGGVTLRFLTRAALFVGRMTVLGAAEPPTAAQLETAAKLQLGAPYSADDVQQARRNIEESLRRNGFYKASVETRESPHLDTRQMDIEFMIHTGARAKFDGVHVSGTTGRTLDEIVRATGWRNPFGIRGWKQLTEARLDDGVDGVRSSFQKHDRLLAKVTLTGLDYHETTNTVTPSLNIETGPLVLVKLVGMRVSRGQVKQLIPVYQERSVDKDLLVEGRRNLVDFLQSQGYFDARVDFSSSGARPGEELITYTVARGARHNLVHLEIGGNKYFTTAALRERMYVMPATAVRYRHGRYSREYLEQDLNSIRDLYRSNGFRDVRIISRTDDDYRGKQGQIAVFLAITEGPQWFVSQLSLQGIPAEDQDAIRFGLRLGAGQPYSDLNIASDRDLILSRFFDSGYPDATFEYVATPDPASQRMDVTYTVHTGTRRLVRGVLLSGLRETRQSLLQRRISLHAGDPLSQAKMNDSQRRLYDLGIFARVQTAFQNPQGQEPAKYVLFDMDEASKYSVTFAFGAEIARIGGGTTDLSNPAGATGFSPQMRIGVSRINFLGLAHTLSLQTQLSTFEQLGLFTYLVPQFHGNDKLDLQFSLLYDYSHYVRTFTNRREEASTQLSQRWSRALTFQYRFLFRKSDIIGTPLISPELIPLLSQPVRVGALSLGVIHDRRDNPVDPHRGVYTTLDLAVAAGLFGSNTDYGRVIFRNATYHRIARSLVLARSTYFGDIVRFGGEAEIPLAERFFSGGSTTDRGFPDNQAGPRDDLTGFPIGGTALLMNTVEMRFPLIGDNIGGVLFHDMGNVYSDLGDLSLRYHQDNLQDFNYAVQTFGFGVRYHTPVGPLRIDLAFSPNSPRFFGYQGTYNQLLYGTGEKVEQRIDRFQFHFSLGQAF